MVKKHFPVYILFVIASLWFSLRVLAPSSQSLTHGFSAYYSASRLLAEGQLSARVYEPDYFRARVRADSHNRADDIYNANPPTTALLLWPLSFLPIETARLAWTLLNALLLLAGLALLIRNFAPAAGLPVYAGLFSLGMVFQPAVQNISLGQGYLLIFLLLAIVVVGWTKNRPGPAGVALALALLLKTAGWAVLLLLLWQRRWRCLAWSAGSAALLLLLTRPLLPALMWPAYLRLLAETSRSPATCATAYQTTRSLLCRLFARDPAWNPSPLFELPWLAPLLLAGLALLSLGLIFKLADRSSAPALLAAITWGVLFAPLGEEYHHAVVLLPLAWLLLHWWSGQSMGWWNRLILVVAVALYLLPLAPNRPELQSGWPVLLAYPRLYAAWLALILLLQSPVPELLPRPAGTPTDAASTFPPHPPAPGQTTSGWP